MTFSLFPTMRETLLFEEHGNSIVASSKPEVETSESNRKSSSSSHISRGGYTRRVSPATIGGDVEKLFPNGDLYTGSFNANAPHGSGKYLWKDGCMYEGEWRKGKASGKGRFSWPSGATFEGEFKSGRMEGFGNFIGSDGETYLGSWSSDRKNGYGQKFYANGDSYEGSWRRNLQDGRGRYVWGNGNSYSGEWKNGIICGRGVLIWANGNRYEGYWDHGVPKGNGIFRWPDGSCLVGCWNKDFSSNLHQRQLQGSFYPSPVLEFQKNTTDCFFPVATRKRSSVESERSFPRICIWESDEAGGDITCDIIDNVEFFKGVTRFDCDGFRQFWRRPCSLKCNDSKKPGEIIFKGHKNYDLMISLQVGIRYSVGKHVSILRDLKPGDFDPNEKFALRFPPEGSKITPPHQSVEFRWKDYCPLVFRHLRELFHVDPADYMLAICGNDALRELCSPGKSGSFFYLTQDDRFMIKTVRKSEVKVLIRMLSSYFNHVCRHENSLVTKFYGVHSIKLIGAQKIRFIVMGNLFYSDYPIHKRFDLKGSSHGRCTDKPEYEIDETTTLKDLDLNYVFHLQTNLFQEIIRQIDMDCEFLEAEGIMDYSLLVGLHFRNIDTGDKMDLFPYLHCTGKQDDMFQNIDRILCGGKAEIRVGANMPARAERRARVSSSSSSSHGCGGERFEVVLYFGIIDILQDYDISKKLEHAYKSFQADPTSISAVGPKLYSKRFREFIGRIFIEDR